MNNKGYAAEIAHGVSARKRVAIVEKAKVVSFHIFALATILARTVSLIVRNDMVIARRQGYQQPSQGPHRGGLNGCFFATLFVVIDHLLSGQKIKKHKDYPGCVKGTRKRVEKCACAGYWAVLEFERGKLLARLSFNLVLSLYLCDSYLRSLCVRLERGRGSLSTISIGFR